MSADYSEMFEEHESNLSSAWNSVVFLSGSLLFDNNFSSEVLIRDDPHHFKIRESVPFD